MLDFRICNGAHNWPKAAGLLCEIYPIRLCGATTLKPAPARFGVRVDVCWLYSPFTLLQPPQGAGPLPGDLPPSGVLKRCLANITGQIHISLPASMSTRATSGEPTSAKSGNVAALKKAISAH